MPLTSLSRVGALLALLATATPAGAQPRGRVILGPVLGSYTVSADAVDGTTGMAGVVASMPINALLDFEIEMLRPFGTVSREHRGTSFSLAPPGSSREEIERQGVFTRFTHERRVDGVLSFGAAFHPRRSQSRFEPRACIGITTHFARERERQEPLTWPAHISREDVLRRQPPEQVYRRALGSITLGVSLGIELTPRIVVVPDLRYDYGSMGDEINNVVRAGVRLLYRF